MRAYSRLKAVANVDNNSWRKIVSSTRSSSVRKYNWMKIDERSELRYGAALGPTRVGDESQEPEWVGGGEIGFQ